MKREYNAKRVAGYLVEEVRRRKSMRCSWLLGLVHQRMCQNVRLFSNIPPTESVLSDSMTSLKNDGSEVPD